MLAANLSLEFHELHEGLFGQHIQEYFFQCAFSFNSIVIIQFLQLQIDLPPQLFGIHLIITGHIPMVCKKAP